MNEMKQNLIISTTDRRFSMKLPPEECQSRFDAIVRDMINGACSGESPAQPPGISSNIPQPPPETNQETPPSQANIEKPTIIEKPQSTGRAYKGFIYAVCQHCGDAHGFYERNEITVNSCRKCGKMTPLVDLIPMLVYCKCGRQFRYMTNATASLVELNCPNCSAPVTLEHNAKRRCYNTIGGRG